MPTALGWHLRQRITLPVRPEGFFRRPSLSSRAAPTARPLTLVVAPGGFGKTSLLSECCHDALDAGVPVAWITLAGEDGAELDVNLAHAARQAGLDVGEPLDACTNVSSAHPRTDLLLAAVEELDGPFLLVLDEAERLVAPAPTVLVNHLLRAAPSNLHIALAARELPPRLDVGSHPMADSTAILTAEDLRFSREEIAGFFDRRLSRRELARVASTSAGWPIALRIRRNRRRVGSASQRRVLQDVFGNWIEARLWAGLDAADRDFLLDVGLLDWFDAALLDQVLLNGAMRRLAAMRTLDGLLVTVRGGGTGARSLHPLIREHSARRRRRDTPARYRDVHVRIARALAARDRTVEAMRHAAEADNRALAATILAEAGGVRLCLRQGLDQLVDADGLVAGDDVPSHPRLVPARSAALAVTGGISEARRLFASQPWPSADDPNGAELHLDRCLAHAIIMHFGCESWLTTETRRMFAHARGLAANDPDPAVRIGMDYLRCVGANIRGDFEDAIEHAYRVRGVPDAMAPFLAPAVEIELGLAAMAQGRVDEALFHYGEGQRLAQPGFLHAPILTNASNLLVREIRLEREGPDGGAAPILPDLRGRATLCAYFATVDIAVETALEEDGPRIAIAMVDGMRAYARQVGLPALARHLAAVRVGLLAEAGRVRQAERAWTAAGLPRSDADCADLGNQSWREVESLSCARLRLFVAKDRLDAGRAFLERVLDVARERRLRRTEMRVLALGMKLERLAGENDAAVAHLREFLALFAETDYARPIAREGEAAAAVIARLLSGEVRASERDAAEALLAAAEARAAGAGAPELRDAPVPCLSKRELEILQRLDELSDAEIAAELGISRHGVRYHIRNLFEKLGSRNRREAARRARAIGILPPPT